MYKVNTAILIAILIFGSGILLKMFDFSSNFEEIEIKLDTSKEELEKMLATISNTKAVIDSLQNRIERLKLKNEFYNSQRDSLVKNFMSEIQKNEMQVFEMKAKHDRSKLKLNYLRKENDKFH